ncbi:glutathione S-transferase family protein [Ferrimonas kyonanensis]|uniref:glutathione S-transferase family protein n=1 Tax=Ferrimonas kyonanensis TaxID=364763 RepID=UPI00040655E8|nr:glutathione S-transferase [Ferrimonas kyonanensis]
MKLYEASMTPSAQRVSMFLAEMNLEVERVQVDVRGGENLSEEFLALSPNGRIPVLQLDDGTSLCESIAICRYFDALHPGDHSLFGTTALEKGQVEMWLRMVELQGLMVGFQAFRNLTGVYQDRERCVKAWGEESRLRVEEFLPTLEQRLGESLHLAGPGFSVADISGFVFIRFIANLGITLDDQWPNIQRWYQRVGSRPAFNQ